MAAVIEPGDVLAVAARMLLKKMSRKRRDIVAPIAQRRQGDLDRVQAKQQILPETARGDFAIDVRVGRRQNPNVDTSRPRRAEALELSGGNHAKKLGLLRRRHVGDLVEEQRAAIGQLEPAHAIASRIGERAAHMTEQLTLEDRF